MTVHPYMGIEDVWELAATLSVDSRAPVRVISPPPPVTWIANDKALFDELVARVLGRGGPWSIHESRETRRASRPTYACWHSGTSALA